MLVNQDVDIKPYHINKIVKIVAKFIGFNKWKIEPFILQETEFRERFKVEARNVIAISGIKADKHLDIYVANTCESIDKLRFAVTKCLLTAKFIKSAPDPTTVPDYQNWDRTLTEMSKIVCDTIYKK